MMETQKTISAWAEETFGASGSDFSCVTRANIELAELMHAVAVAASKQDIAEEIADVFIVLYRYAERRGVDARKLAVSHARNYSHLHTMYTAMTPEQLCAELARRMSILASCSLTPGSMDYLGCVFYMLGVSAVVLGVDFYDAVDKKMAVNRKRKRKWTVVGGHGQHVEEDIGRHSRDWDDCDLCQCGHSYVVHESVRDKWSCTHIMSDTLRECQCQQFLTEIV